MKVLHFVDHFTKPTETFIKRYVQKSMQFAETGIAAFEFYDVSDDIKKNAALFKINNPQFSRKNISGIKRFLFEKITGREIWYKQFNEVIAEFKPDVIHCHFGPMGVTMMKFNNKYHCKVPYATTIYAYDITSLPRLNEKYRQDLNRLWVDGSAFFAEGPALAKKFFAYGCPEKKCLINPLLIPVEDYPVKTNYRSIKDPVKFLLIGRFVEKKGFHVFLEAIEQLIGEINEFSIDIVGSGPMQETLERLVAEYHLEPFVKWYGLVKHNDIIPMLKDYDFLMHPSLTAKDGDDEGGSATIIIEAEAVGLPIITTNHADIPYVMGYHDFLAEENDIPSLKDAIKAIIECGNIQQYTKLGRDKILMQHNLDHNDLYENNLKKIIAQS
jgi:colanic acid/amylovoran biosynthesis glycosyltransferase